MRSSFANVRPTRSRLGSCHTRTPNEFSDDYMAPRRWSEPERIGFRKRLKSTWDLKSSLTKDLEEEEESPPRKRYYTYV
jgi:hypothetical protein